MLCISGCSECTGCMQCQDDPKPIMYDELEEPIYAGDTYYDIDGMILTEESLLGYQKTA